MSNIQKVEFEALQVSGDNYLEWALDMRLFLASKKLDACITDGNKASRKAQSQAICHIRHHLATSLKQQYLTIENPLELWQALKKRYDHQKTVLLPQANFDWKNLRFQDYKSVNEYNSELFRIVAIKKLCGDDVTDNDLLEKTLSTFHIENVVLQQQYRAMKHTLYEDLLSCLLLAEKNNQLLMRNSAMRPPGSAPVPDSRKESYHAQRDRSSDHRRGRGNGRGNGRENGRGRRGRGNGRGNRPNLGYGSGRGRGITKPTRNANSDHPACTRCGMFNHWTKQCRTPKFHCELYQKYGKAPAEAHMAQPADATDMDGDDNAADDTTNEQNNYMDYETADLLD